MYQEDFTEKGGLLNDVSLNWKAKRAVLFTTICQTHRQAGRQL